MFDDDPIEAAYLAWCDFVVGLHGAALDLAADAFVVIGSRVEDMHRCGGAWRWVAWLCAEALLFLLGNEGDATR